MSEVRALDRRLVDSGVLRSVRILARHLLQPTDEKRPRALKIGKRHIVIEPPAVYLSRLAEAQKVAA